MPAGIRAAGSSLFATSQPPARATTIPLVVISIASEMRLTDPPETRIRMISSIFGVDPSSPQFRVTTGSRTPKAR